MRISKAAVGAIGAGVLLIAGAALLYAKPDLIFKGGRDPLATLAAGTMTKLVVPEPSAAPDYAFIAPDGSPARLSDFRGKVTVVNVWAMWCAPCREEMPTLAALARAYEGQDVAVVTIDVDHDPEQAGPAAGFLRANAPLPFYRDPKFQLPFELPGKGGMPQTVLVDRQGRIRAHLTGGADWASPEARRVVDALLAEPA
ncbi:TlpA family protein disulfide reductase [Brevundimonas sp. NPDC092305]|uniref:TlpA family protein disulfide reductase n=1 Tax=Brevundimonas sp. NPDC092305 TaxID=3363957 RepID=UPI003808F6D8